ncbi:MAG: helicase-exonuclease AddAB subunit AddA, partial [Actinobacteria bacterium]|nr:helicase-exonuclease AddAB subunit AddA [Actinomycetota bacterium]
ERIGRIIRELSEREPGDNRLAQKAARVSTAAISTIHSFCQTVLRQNFARAKLDPQFKIADADQAMLLKNAALEEVFEELYLDGGPAGETFRELVQMYGSGEDNRLGKLVIRLHDFFSSLVSPEQWCKKARQWLEPVGDRPSPEMLKAYGELLVEHFKQRMSLCQSNAQKIRMLLEQPELRAFNPGDYDKLVSFTQTLERLTKGWLGLIEQVQKGAFDKLADGIERLIIPRTPQSPRPKDPQVKAAIEQIKKLFREAAPSPSKETLLELCATPLKDQARTLRSSLPYARMMIDLANRLDHRYGRAKQTENLLDFTDLERKCLELLNDGSGEELKPSIVARQLQEKYRYVLVDEYQDINPLQDAILRLVSRELTDGPGNLFAVGDLKQSIYRFRLAEPQVFQDRLRRLGAEQLGRVIDLQSNFRSRAGIINGVNLLFERLMQAEPAGIVYDEHASLKPGQKDYEKVRDPEKPAFSGAAVEVHLLTKRTSSRATTEDEEGESIEAAAQLEQTQQEAVLLGKRVRHLMGLEESAGRMQVMDKDPQTGRAILRPLAYRDIAILLRVTTRQAEVFAQVLRQMDIPVYADAETGYFAATEVQDVLALLEILDNPLQDIPLAAVLRSPIGGFEADELAQIRLVNKEGAFHQAVFELAEASDSDRLTKRLGEFCRRLRSWRKLVRDIPLAEAIWEIYQQSHYLYYVAGLPGGTGRQANLLKLHERARQFGTFTRTGLGRFLQFIRDLQKREADLKLAPGISEAEDVVRIMSVHKSKGLEFPVVILPRLSRSFNFTDAHGNIIIDRDRYLGLHYVDRQQQTAYPTLGHRLAERNIKKHVLAEEMRLLYVAMTRAKEHLILVGSGSENKLEPFSPEALNRQISGCDPPGPCELAAGKSWLNWLVPTLASLGPADLQFGGPVTHPELTHGKSTFVVSSYEPEVFAEDIFAEDFGKHHRRGGLTLEQIASLEPPAEEIKPDKDLIESLAIIEQPYRYEGLSGMPAVVPITERKRLFEAGADEDLDAAGQIQGWDEALVGLPELLSAKSGELSAAQIGSLNHLFLQKVDLTRTCNLQDLQQQAQKMAKQGLFESDSLDVLDFKGIEEFFVSEIGKTMLAKPESVYREIPFILAIEPGEIVKGTEAQGPADCPLLRGVIDVLIVEDGQATIVDFKTDRVRGKDINQRAEHYRWQMQMYGRAVKDILGWVVSRKVLYFLRPRQSVTIN